MYVGADGVAIIAICNPPVNALHPASKDHYSLQLSHSLLFGSVPWRPGLITVVLSSGGSCAGTRMQSLTGSVRCTAGTPQSHQSHSCCVTLVSGTEMTSGSATDFVEPLLFFDLCS